MKRSELITLVVLAALLATLGLPALAAANHLRATLSGYQEVPTVSSSGRGSFRGHQTAGGAGVQYSLTYAGVGTPTAAHLHFGAVAIDGGIIAFLCGGGGKPACPASGTPVNGTIAAGDITAVQGLDTMAELLRALQAGVVYVNVHTSTFPGGEIRGQIRPVPLRSAEEE
jgi:hypothetical protein